MAITITDATMRSDQTPHTASYRAAGISPDADANGVHPAVMGWTVTWLPGRVLDRSQAVTAMTLAEESARLGSDLVPGHRMWAFTESWAGELGLTGHEAVAMAARAPGEAGDGR